MILEQYKPIFFITLTWTTWCSRDDIENEARKYLFRLARICKGHIKSKIGTESGSNSHAHLVVWSNDIKPYKFDIRRFRCRKMFGFGRVDFQKYDPMKSQSEYGDYGAVFYTLKHQGVEDAGEVICGSRKNACVKDRCPERRKVVIHNARLRQIEIEKLKNK